MKKKKKQNNTVALVMVPGLDDAPYDNESFDIWIINGCFRRAERFDLLFDMHDWVGSDYTPLYYDEMIELDCPIVKPAHDPNIKNEILYPKELLRIFPFQLKHSSCYMLALAWYERYKNIYFYGLTGDEFERHPYMGYAFYYILGRITSFKKYRGEENFLPTVYFANEMALDNPRLYGMDLQWRKSDMMFEGGFMHFRMKRWEDEHEELMLNTSKKRKQTDTE